MFRRQKICFFFRKKSKKLEKSASNMAKKVRIFFKEKDVFFCKNINYLYFFRVFLSSLIENRFLF